MAVARIRRNVGGARQRSMGSLNQPRVSWSRQEANWEVLISPTSCSLSRSEEETTINSGRAGKTAYSALLRFGGGKKKKKKRSQQVIPTTSGFFSRSGGPTVITLCCLFCAPLIIFPHSVQSDALFRNGQVMAKLKPNTVFAEWKI